MTGTGLFVVLEKAWAGVDDFYPQLAVDNCGKILKFNTREEAEKYCKNELQDGQVIEIIGGVREYQNG